MALQLVPMGPDKRIGSELAGYRIVEPLGRGGTSVVYRAEHVRLGRPAALKLLAPGLGEADFGERFLRESRLAASLDHPSIVPIYDAGEENGLLYIAMACVEGSDLRTLLAREGRLPLRRALRFVGTIEYCAPEQIEGRPVDARTDVYALACVLYECLTGKPPFHRPSEVAVLNAHLHAPPPKLTRATPELPGALEAVIAKALSKSPLDRYGSCAELLAAARGAVAERRVHRRRLPVSLTLLALPAALGPAGAPGIPALVDRGGGGAAAAPPAAP